MLPMVTRTVLLQTGIHQTGSLQTIPAVIAAALPVCLYHKDVLVSHPNKVFKQECGDKRSQVINDSHSGV